MTSFVLFHKPAGFSYYFITGTIPEEVVTLLNTDLSYSVKNADYAQIALAEKHARANIEREKNGEAPIDYPPWDGKVHFLKLSKRKKLFFPIGLKERAKRLLSFYDIEVKERDEYNDDEIKEEFSWKGPQLRDYQIDATLKAIRLAGGVISLPTGTGKSLILMRLIYAIGVKSIILVPSKTLFAQWKKNVETIFGLEGIAYGNGIFVYPGITIAMVQTLHSGLRNKNAKALEVASMQYDLLAIDEAHHTPADTFYSVAKHIDARHKYGFSATVEREDGAEMKMEAALGPVIVSTNYDDVKKHLAKPVFEFVEVSPGFATGKTFAQVYKNGVVSNQMRNVSISRRAQELVAEGRQVYIHVEQILHGEILSKMMKAPFVYSKSKDREETIETFKKGYTRVLISTLLGEGVDIPSISAIIMAGGRKTEAGTIQKIGRALRPDEKFNTAVIVDFADRGRYLSEHAMARYMTYVKFYGEDVVRGRK